MKLPYRVIIPLWLCASMLLATCGGQTAANEAPTGTASPPTEAPAAEESAAALPTATSAPTDIPAPFELSTSAYAESDTIPTRYACTGDDLSPDLSWGEPPAGTQSFVLLFDDPDAFGWVHWLLYNLPAETRDLAEGVETGAGLPAGSLQGATSWGTLGYRGPCPPVGSTHTYAFTLYALDTRLDLEAGADVDRLQLAMDGHILEQIEYTGEFSR